jgi:hypothetical protein
MRQRRLWLALIILLVAVGLGIAVYEYSQAAPAAMRLLPDSDAVLFINLRLMRAAHVFREVPPVSYDPDYEQFVKETGFQFERDLDQAAFALHAPSMPQSNHEGFFERVRYSEIFIGRFDASRATAYFRKLAANTEEYREAVIYTIPREDRSVRVTLLASDMVAVSNTPQAGAIHQMIDNYRAARWWAPGPALVRQHYRQVPLGSIAWVLARVPAQQAQGPVLALPGGMEMPARWLAGSTIVASARQLGALHLRIEALTASEDDARRLLETARTFFAIVRSLESSMTQGGADADVKALFSSLTVEENGARVALTVTIPQGFIRKALTPAPNPPAQAQPGTPPNASKERERRDR